MLKWLRRWSMTKIMFILEYKLKGKAHQYQAIDESIQTVQFVRNKCLRYWEDGNNDRDGV